MGYHIYLYRKEVKENNSGLEFLENESLIQDFEPNQKQSLRERLLRYGFIITNEAETETSFSFKTIDSSVRANLRSNCLSFVSSYNEEDLFEIQMTASEFTDTGEFLKFDPQNGAWEEIM